MIGQPARVDSGAAEQKVIDGVQHLAVECWGMHTVVYVPATLVARGQTLQCSPACTVKG